MRRFLISQHERFSKSFDCEPHTFAEECLRFQNNGYADKLGAYAKVYASTKALEPSLPDALLADFKELYGFEAIAFDGAIDVVRELSLSFRVGIVSNGRSRGQMAKIESSGLRDYLSTVVISESHGEKKPNPSIFRECLDRLDCPPFESIYVGDNPSNDIAPAKDIGMFAIWLRNDHFDPPRICDAIAENIKEIPHIIARINAQQGGATDATLRRH